MSLDCYQRTSENTFRHVFNVFKSILGNYYMNVIEEQLETD